MDDVWDGTFIIKKKIQSVLPTNCNYFIWSFWNEGNKFFYVINDLGIFKVHSFFHRERLISVFIKYSVSKAFPAIEWFSDKLMQTL